MFSEFRQIMSKISQGKMQANRTSSLAKEGLKAVKGDKSALKNVAARQGISVPQGMVPKGMVPKGMMPKGGKPGAPGGGEAPAGSAAAPEAPATGMPDRPAAVRPSQMRKG